MDAALHALFEWPSFARSERLKAFLSYVVDETLAGRADAIRAKTIAQDVYGRDPTRDDFSDNIVRVDARRLRRLLSEYYQSQGDKPALRIRIEKGSYAPEFTGAASLAEDRPKGHKRASFNPRFAALTVALASVACIGVFLASGLADSREQNASSVKEETETAIAARTALFENSGAVLQARNLCTQGRGMLFPIADPQQQAIATDMFKRAVELAPDYFCGFAGAAHSLSTQVLLASDRERRDDYLAEAQSMADRAHALAPTDGWAVSGLAWAAFAHGDTRRATELSKLSEELSPTDGNVLDFHGLISLLTGDYAEARKATNPSRKRDTTGLNHAHLNIYGVASFHAGDYAEAISAWNDAVRMGQPVSALTLIYLTAAYQAKGDEDLAIKHAEALQKSFPTFPVGPALSAFYTEAQQVDEILALLSKAGWMDETDASSSRDEG